jgi:hypothetical protein
MGMRGEMDVVDDWSHSTDFVEYFSGCGITSGRIGEGHMGFNTSPIKHQFELRFIFGMYAPKSALVACWWGCENCIERFGSLFDVDAGFEEEDESLCAGKSHGDDR